MFLAAAFHYLQLSGPIARLPDAATVLAQGFASFSEGEFTLYVQGPSGEPLDGRGIAVLDGGRQLAYAESDGGVVNFANLPRKRLVFTDGPDVRVFDLSRRTTAIMRLG